MAIPDLLTESTPVAPSAVVAPAGNVTVEVSGSRFCVVPSLFKKVEKLAWYEHRSTLHLNASPDVFEILLQYFLFDSLPDVSSLPGHELSELELLVKPLPKVENLVEHIETCRKASKRRSSTSFFMRSLPSLTSGKSLKKQRNNDDEISVQEETVYPFAISPTNPEIQAEVRPILEPTYSTESDDTSQAPTNDVSDDATTVLTATSSSKQSEKTSQKCRRILRNIVDSAKKAPRSLRKRTHEEWCAEFDFVL
jgi:hypothetical protein